MEIEGKKINKKKRTQEKHTRDFCVLTITKKIEWNRIRFGLCVCGNAYESILSPLTVSSLFVYLSNLRHDSNIMPLEDASTIKVPSNSSISSSSSSSYGGGCNGKQQPPSATASNEKANRKITYGTVKEFTIENVSTVHLPSK